MDSVAENGISDFNTYTFVDGLAKFIYENRLALFLASSIAVDVFYCAFQFATGIFFGPIVDLCFIFSQLFLPYYFSDSIAKITQDLRTPNLSNPKEEYAVESVRKFSEELGIEVPVIYIIDDNSKNACANENIFGNSHLCITKGLLDAFELDSSVYGRKTGYCITKNEFQAIIGHELGHIYNRDVTSSFSFIAAYNFLEYFFELFMLYWELSFVLIFSIELLSITGAAVVFFNIMRSHELSADRVGAELTGGPEGLAVALKKLHGVNKPNQAPLDLDYSEVNKNNDTGVLSYFFDMFKTHPSLSTRVDSLAETEAVKASRIYEL